MTRVWMLAWIGALACVGTAAHAIVTQQITPARINLGEAAQLTIAVSDDTSVHLSPPSIPGVEFDAVGQSRRVESVNGVTHSTVSVIYRVTPRQIGVFDIPGAAPGLPSLTLTVVGGTAASTPGAAPGTPTSEVAALVRVRLTKHELYVGETIPVDIEVATHDGMVSAMNGPPTLNGDAFVLEPLTAEPQRTTEVIDNEAFTVFTWHSTLAATKPGKLSMTLSSPLTVRVRTPAQNTRRFFDDPNDFFNDPNFRGLFGGIAEKSIDVSSKPDEFNVLALPLDNKPAGFTGAVGHFTLTSDLSADHSTVGDPLTLRLKVSGTGNFDRVDTPVLHDPEHWKAYAPTATFKRDAQGGIAGEKTFEQALIAKEAGVLPIPAVSFSWFDPDSRRYETAHTAPLSAAISPAAIAPATNAPFAGAAPVVAPNEQRATLSLRPDHVETDPAVSSLQPRYARPIYIAAPLAIVAALTALLLWPRRRENITDAFAASTGMQRLIEILHEAGATRDARRFFAVARQLLQGSFAAQWQMRPQDITVDEVEAHLGPDSPMLRIFILADESAYAGHDLQSVDLQSYERLVLQQIQGRAVAS